MSERRFHLVQRLQLSRASDFTKTFPKAKVRSNPFGYGRLGDYELDYMGAAEFEFGEIPKANNRLAEAELVIEPHEFNGHPLTFLWREKDGDPRADFDAWVKAGCNGKEPPYRLGCFLRGEPPWRGASVPAEDELGAEVWWALEENVMWSLGEPEASHLRRMLGSMQETLSEFLR